tara:strand:+ start:474 stop:629 length:156 start_codon:yes stop_codon:yes gene_type:complete
MVFAADDALTKYETIYVPVADSVAKSAADIATLVCADTALLLSFTNFIVPD